MGSRTHWGDTGVTGLTLFKKVLKVEHGIEDSLTVDRGQRGNRADWAGTFKNVLKADT